MEKGVKTFQLCTLKDRGTVEWSPEGLDVIRSLLMRWIIQAEKGEAAAKSIGGFGAASYAGNQAAYFRAAGSFLVARLVSHLSDRVNLKDELGIIAKWRDSQDIPDRWVGLLSHALSSEGDGGTLNPTTGGGGAGGGGADGRSPVDSGHAGKMEPSEPDGSPPASDTAAGGMAAGKAARRTRAE